MTRSLPNILITGTPGTGKTTLCEYLISNLPSTFKTFDVTNLIKEHNLHTGYDKEFQSYIFDDDKVVDYLEDEFKKHPGGNIVDFHTCDFFPERWFDLVVVLRTDNTILYKRLEKRGYPQKKITENVECEIMQVLLDEARESYKENIIVELHNNSVSDMENNAKKILNWIKNWKPPLN